MVVIYYFHLSTSWDDSFRTSDDAMYCLFSRLQMFWQNSINSLLHTVSNKNYDKLPQFLSNIVLMEEFCVKKLILDMITTFPKGKSTDAKIPAILKVIADNVYHCIGADMPNAQLCAFKLSITCFLTTEWFWMLGNLSHVMHSNLKRNNGPWNNIDSWLSWKLLKITSFLIITWMLPGICFESTSIMT